MATILDCANETLIDIFKHLDNIDSVLWLARSCRQLCNVYRSYWLEILKHVILHSEAHKHDIRLCHFNEAFYEFSSAQLHIPEDERADDAHPPHVRFEECLKADDLSPGQVWDVLARWQGLKLIRDLYTNCAVHSSYTERTGRALNQDFVEEPILDILKLSQHPLGTHCPKCASLALNAAESSRFYTALIQYWLSIEMLRYANTCRFERRTQQLHVFQQVWEALYEHDSLRSALETLEAYDFTYDYLAQNTQIASVAASAAWRLDEPMFDSDGDWHYFVSMLRLTLSPADVLHLLVLTSRWRNAPPATLVAGGGEEWSPERKTRFVRETGVFEPGTEPANRDTGNSPDEWLEVTTLEDVCLEQLRSARDTVTTGEEVEGAHHTNVVDVSSVLWKRFRGDRWQGEARGNFRGLMHAWSRFEERESPGALVEVVTRREQRLVSAGGALSGDEEEAEEEEEDEVMESA